MMEKKTEKMEKTEKTEETGAIHNAQFLIRLGALLEKSIVLQRIPIVLKGKKIPLQERKIFLPGAPLLLLLLDVLPHDHAPVLVIIPIILVGTGTSVTDLHLVLRVILDAALLALP